MLNACFKYINVCMPHTAQNKITRPICRENVCTWIERKCHVFLTVTLMSHSQSHSLCQLSIIQLSAVIRRFNLSWYYIRHCEKKWHKMNQILESQPTSHISPHVWTMGCPLWGIWKNWPRYNRTALYFCMISPSLRTATILQVNMFVGFMIYVKWWYSYVLISAFMLIA